MLNTCKIWGGFCLLMALLLAGCSGKSVRLEDVEMTKAQPETPANDQPMAAKVPEQVIGTEAPAAERPIAFPAPAPPPPVAAIMPTTPTNDATASEVPPTRTLEPRESATPARPVTAAPQPVTAMAPLSAVDKPAAATDKPPVSTTATATGTAAVSPLLLFCTGLGLLVLVIGIILFKPNPVGLQVLVFRTTLALAAASIAASIPGFLEIKTEVLSAGMLQGGGAIGVFLLVYFFNPGKLGKAASKLADDDNTD